MAPTGWIRKFHKTTPDATIPLLIFPHAGAGASSYRALSKLLSAHFDVIIFQYPGRQDRVAEPPCTDLADIAAGAFAEFQTSEYNNGVPFMTFGHSMGAVVSFQFARLAEAAGVAQRQATLSAAVAPCRGAFRPPAPTGDEELLDHLASLEGTGADVLASRELMRMTLPVLKADHAAADAFRCPQDITIATRIHAIGGDADPLVTLADLNGWRTHASDVEVTIFDGGHFYLNDHLEEITELLVQDAALPAQRV
ncbi:alpha/beta fold hydrolase [Gordonia sp. ABSL1-1]|uniref:thioesterase II family protein n=1 Tax=Gordonia sp. ABSL1-1 TaxID=3053923 RepID=UPI002573937D|nr:alpha/beta fold hydrolase [Gordonia sp. ABSL1-1]MDL9937472.1 alpha/beta fold hydrolase [Gordonia sp. ABSL1-1]